MKRTARWVGLIFLGLVCLLLAIPAMLTWRQVRQARLNQALIAAVKANNDKAVVSLLQEGADANCRDEPPHYFSSWQTLIQVLHPLPSQPSHAPTALSLAITGYEQVSPGVQPGEWIHRRVQPQENLPLLRALLDHGAHVNQPGALLMGAISRGDKSVVHLLLDRGANARATGIMATAVRDAEVTDTDIVADLLDHGADVNQRDEQSWTPLFRAIDLNSVDVVRLLLARNADPTLVCDGSTPLARVRTPRDREAGQIVRLLKAAGAKRSTHTRQ